MSENQLHRAFHQLARLQLGLQHLKESQKVLADRVEDVLKRLNRIEPVSAPETGRAEWDDGKLIPISSFGDLFGSSEFLKRAFDEEGRVIHDEAAGLARGVFPDHIKPMDAIFFCGDDVNEKDVSLYRHGIFALGQHLNETNGKGPACFFSRCGREKTQNELENDARIVVKAPSIVVEVLPFYGRGYASFLQWCVHFAEGRKIFLVEPDDGIDITQYNNDQHQANFIGPRTRMTERERQMEVRDIFKALVQRYSPASHMVILGFTHKHGITGTPATFKPRASRGGPRACAGSSATSCYRTPTT